MISLRKKFAAVALGTSLLATGAAGAYAFTGSASAQAATSTTSPAAATAPAAASTSESATPGDPADSKPGFDPAKGGHVGANGVKEQLLTGDVAAKVQAAALAAVPGGTIQRVENDAEGATYEAHMTKADGSHVTVKLDASFNVTSIDSNVR
jgi:ABC-type transport system substrate-binding protein